MALFSRRKLQQIINENSFFIDHAKLVNQIARLNQGSIDTEWELVILNAFHNLGQTDYEPALGGTSFVDMYFKSSLNPFIEFVADITTVSDAGLKLQNRQEDFQKELNKRLREKRLLPSKFFWGIDSELIGKKQKQKMHLKLPEKPNWLQVFDKDFNAFLNQINLQPKETHQYIKNDDYATYCVIYNPKQNGQAGNYSAFDVAYSITKNPIRNALDGKINQLRSSGYSGVRAIILCDGGCGLLREEHKSYNTHLAGDVINKFLRDYSTVDFIVSLTVHEIPARGYAIKPVFYKNTFHNKDPLFFENVIKILDHFPKHLPQPQTTASNAQLRLRTDGISFNGGIKMTHNTIKISSRALQKLLSGTLSADKFFDDHRNFSFPNTHYFHSMLQEGRLFEQISIEKCVNEDDDWVVFKFSEPDPAISPFRCPPQ